MVKPIAVLIEGEIVCAPVVKDVIYDKLLKSTMFLHVRK